MQSFLVVVQVLLGAAMIGVILMQHGKGADAGAAFGSGASATVFGARGSATFLTKITALLAILFFSNSLVLDFLSTSTTQPSSVMEGGPQEQGSGPTGELESIVQPVEESEEKASGATPEESDLPEVPGVEQDASDDSPPVLGEERTDAASGAVAGQGGGSEATAEGGRGQAEGVPAAPAASTTSAGDSPEEVSTDAPDGGAAGAPAEPKKGLDEPGDPQRPAPETTAAAPAKEPLQASPPAAGGSR